MKQPFLLGALCVISFCPAYASLFSFDFLGGVGTGSQVVPPNASGATLTAVGISYDDVSNELIVNAIYSGLSGDISGSTVNGASDLSLEGGPGTTAPVNFSLDNTGATSGFLSGSKTLTAQEEINLLAGRWYVSAQTVAFPGGEVRGQLITSAVPEPEEYAALAGAGLLGLAVFRRLRRSNRQP